MNYSCALDRHLLNSRIWNYFLTNFINSFINFVLLILLISRIMETDEQKLEQNEEAKSTGDNQQQPKQSKILTTTPEKPFALKKWNLVATWAWDVECDTCAICRVHLMEACLRCQSDSKQQECVVIWGECNHCFHLCCMSLWVKQNNRCPLCQADWNVQRVGK